MKLDDYQLNRLIGKGSFGEVYETTNSSNQVFATKIIKKSKLIGIVKEYFEREVTISKILEHENIIKLIDIKESEIEHYLIMEYADGFNLSELLSYYKEIYKKTLPEKYVRSIIKQLSSAIEYLHNHWIVHRDLKLENVLFVFDDEDCKQKLKLEKGKIKLIDFGFARIFEENENILSIVGSPNYMSPQLLLKIFNQNHKIDDCDWKTDLWSLGIMTFELLNGELPFLGRNLDQLSELVVKGDYYISKNLGLSFESIEFVQGLLQFYSKDRINWPAIRNHNFINLHKKFESYDFEKIPKDYIEKGSLKLNAKKQCTLFIDNKFIDEDKTISNYGIVNKKRSFYCPDTIITKNLNYREIKSNKVNNNYNLNTIQENYNNTEKDLIFIKIGDKSQTSDTELFKVTYNSSILPKEDLSEDNTVQNKKFEQIIFKEKLNHDNLNKKIKSNDQIKSNIKGLNNQDLFSDDVTVLNKNFIEIKEIKKINDFDIILSNI